MADRSRHRPITLTKGALETGEHRWVDEQPFEPPLLLESRQQPLQVTRRAGQVGLSHIDVMEPHHRIDRQCADPRPLAHDLAMDLALRRDVDDDVLDDLGGAAEPVAGGQRPARLIVGLGRAGLGESVGASLYSGPAADHHLAPPTDPAPTTHGVEIDTQGPGGIQHGGPLGKRSTAP